MKRIISLILAFVMLFASLVLTLSSCGSFIEAFKSGFNLGYNTSIYQGNLGDDYEIEIYEVSDEAGEEEIQEIAGEFDVDYEDYGITLIMFVEDDATGDHAYFIFCESNEMAEEFAEDIEDIAKFYYYELVVDGNFVLVGEEDIVNTALGK